VEKIECTLIKKKPEDESTVLEEEKQQAALMKKQLEDEKRELEAEKQQWALTKRKLDTVHFSKIVKLSIGGKIFKQSLDILLIEPRSFFGAMFSRAWEVNLDEEGAYFIDRDWKHFRSILNYLRTGKLVLPDNESAQQELMIEAEFYGLDTLLTAIKQIRGAT
jgi:hypothetical protein